MPAWDAAACTHARAQIRGPDDAARVLLTALGTGECDRNAVLALSADRRIVSLAAPGPHDVTSAIFLRRAVEIAEQWSAPTIVLATQRRGEPACPTPTDVDQFLEVRGGGTRHGILVVDWLILRRHHWWSLHELASASR